MNSTVRCAVVHHNVDTWKYAFLIRLPFLQECFCSHPQASCFCLCCFWMEQQPTECAAVCATAINGHEDVLRLTEHWRLASDRWCSTQPLFLQNQWEIVTVFPLFSFLRCSWISLVPEVKRTYEILTSSVSTENSIIPVSRVSQDSYPSAPGASNPSESCSSPTNFASTTEGIIESGQYKGKTFSFLNFAAAFCAFFSPRHLSLPLNIAQTKQLFVAFVLFVFLLCLYFYCYIWAGFEFV